MVDGDPQPAFLKAFPLSLPASGQCSETICQVSMGRKLLLRTSDPEPWGVQQHSVVMGCRDKPDQSREAAVGPSSPAKGWSETQVMATRVFILSPGSRGRVRDRQLTHACPSLWSCSEHICEDVGHSTARLLNL